jgi:hypothetical protein
MLPPPDPSEPGNPPDGYEVFAPTTMYLYGRPTRARDRVADAILAVRPGLLVVCARD